MLNTEEMSGTNCIAWFKIKTKGMKPDAIGQLIEEMREGTGLAPQADPFGERDDSNWLLYGVYDSVGDEPSDLTGKDEEFSERWEYGINVYEIVNEKVLKDLYGKEDVLLQLKEKYGVEYQLYFCTFLDLDMADVDGYGDNDISLPPKAMALLSKIGADKKLHKTSEHTVSPYQFILRNQRYYLMAYNEKWQNMGFYRLDRITDMRMTRKPATAIRSVKGYESGIDYRAIATSLPYMFTDKPEYVEFLADAGIIDQIVDWFGDNARIEQSGDRVKVGVRVSPMAMEYWAMQYLNAVEILSPASLRSRILANLEAAREKYN